MVKPIKQFEISSLKVPDLRQPPSDRHAAAKLSGHHAGGKGGPRAHLLYPQGLYAEAGAL